MSIQHTCYHIDRSSTDQIPPRSIRNFSFSSSLGTLLSLDNSVYSYLVLNLFQIYSRFALPHGLHIRHSRMLLAFENGIDLFQAFALGLNPVHSLEEFSKHVNQHSAILTIRIMTTISHEPFTMYIFHPMLSSPIGMTKTSTHLCNC